MFLIITFAIIQSDTILPHSEEDINNWLYHNKVTTVDWEWITYDTQTNGEN